MVERDVVRQGYDQVAAQYEAERDEDGHSTTILEEFLTTLPGRARILDAGCGSGVPVLRRLCDGSTAVGLDLSREQLRRAAENVPDAQGTQGDMTALPFAADTFDAVVAYWSLIHVPGPDHQTVLDEFARVLCRGGRLLVCEAAEPWTGENPDWLNAGIEMQWEMAGAAATREQLRDAGFTVTATWDAPTSLAYDRRQAGDAGETTPNGRDADEAADDPPWTFFAARRAPGAQV